MFESVSNNDCLKLKVHHTAVFEIKGAPCTRCAHFRGQVHKF